MAQRDQIPGEHRARKRFGQNFLTDPNIVERIVSALGLQRGDAVVEIGPGKGALTRQLAERCDRLSAIELDRDLVPWLKVMFEHHGGFEIHQADALRFDYGQLAGEKPLRVVGNLPYNISTPLIFYLLGFVGQIADMHFMLQKEVVARMAAAPGQKSYGRLSVMVQYHCRVERLFTVPPGAFSPAPKVESAIVRLTPHTELPHPADDAASLARLVNVAFQQRRKTLRNALKQLVPVETLDALPLDTSVRPETLSVADFVQLSNQLHPILSDHE